MVAIRNIKAGARAIGYEETAGGIVTYLCKEHGLVIGNSSLEFPDYLLNTVTWVVGDKYDILAGEDPRWLDADEINEMRALKRLLDRLTKMGGVQELEYDTPAEMEMVEPFKRNEEYQGNRNYRTGDKYASKYGYTCEVLAVEAWSVRVRWDANGQEGSVPFYQMEEDFNLIGGAK